jgi:hypothetical protein
LKQADIVKQFDHLCVGGKTGKDGTMSRAGMHTMFKDQRFGLNVEEISSKYFQSTIEYLPIRLQKGLVILGYWETFIPGWHVGLVYGIDDKSVSYMNPDYTKGGYLKNDLSYFTSGKGNLIVAWPAW